MFSFAKHNLRALGLLAFALGTLAHAEPGYPGRDNGFSPNDPLYDYSAEIQKNKNRMAQKPGEGDAAYRERTSHLYTEYTVPPVAKDDVASGQGTVDFAEKLKDAQRFSQEGAAAATAQAADMYGAQVGLLTVIFDAGNDLGKIAQANADAAVYNKAASKYGDIQLAMQAAAVHNGNGFARLRYDPEDGDGAGKAPPPDPKFVAEIVDRLSDEQKKKLEDRGVDPENFVERLLSGEIDTSDPNSVLRALNETRQLSSAELAEVAALTEAKLADGEPASGAGIDVGGSELKETRELASTTDKGGKDELKDPSNTTTPGLAGIAIRLINREVMGYRLSDLLGGKGKKDALKTASAPVKGKGVTSSASATNGKVALKKLTATDFYQLQGRGITAPRHGNNIFKMAHRQFRDYSKWRDHPQPTKGRVALAR